MVKASLFLHKLKTVFFYSVASVIIIIALGVSSLRLILTTANLYQEEVEQLASTLLEQPVKIGRMDAELSGMIPTLIFHNAQILSKQTKKPLFILSRIDVGLSFKNLILQQAVIPEQITIKGMNLHVTRKVDGSYKIKGFDLESLIKISDSESNSLLESWLQEQGEIGLEDSTFTWIDEQNAGHTWYFDDVNFLFKKDQERYQFLLSNQLPRVMGKKIKLSFDLEGDITKPSTWDVKAYIESKRFKLSSVKNYINKSDLKFESGTADFKLWLDWENNKLKQLSGDLKLHDLLYKLKKAEMVKLSLVSGLFDATRDNNGKWNVSVDKFNYKSDAKVSNESKFSLAFNFLNEDVDSFDIRADYLDLKTVSKIIVDNHLVQKEHENIIKNINFQGEVHDFYIGWKDNKLNTIKANFNDFGINAWNNIPKVAQLSGDIFYENKEGKISLLANNSTIGFPKIFRKDFKLDELKANIDFLNTTEGLLFDVTKTSIKNSDVEATSNTKIWFPKDGSSPHIDLQVYVLNGDISKVSHFLPINIMSNSLVDWIDNSLEKGKVNKATVILNGSLKDFPYDNKEGEFSVEVEASDFTMNYRSGWPKITNAKVNSVFTGQGFKLHLLSGETENNTLYDSSAEIESYRNAELNLNILTTSSTKSAVQYLINSPILSKSKKIINTMRFAGDVSTKFKMNIPLADKILKEKSLSYSGTSVFSDASVFMLKDKVDITEGTGALLFTEKGLSSKNLRARLFGEKAKLSVKSTLKDKSIKIAVNGKLKPNVVLSRFEIPGARNISGKTNFKAKMVFPDGSKENNKPYLKVKSNLIGVKSQLPDSFYKKSKKSYNFNFTTLFSGANTVQFSAGLGNYGSAIVELDQSGKDSFLKRGAVSFSKEKAVLPNKNILYVDGSLNEITPSRWFDALDLQMMKRKTSFFVYPIIFNLDSLKLLTIKKDTENKISKITNPKKLPKFEGIVKKLYLDNVFLGRLDFKSSKKEYGLHFDEVILSSKNMKLFSHGNWKYKNGKHKTEMDLTLSSHDFGGMLNNLGFAAVIRKGTARGAGELHWWGAPTQFSLGKLNGDIQLKIENGNVKEVDAGAGRLLGLFSLSALPRKLFGDFNDIFKSGFSFDTAEGSINIEDGDAYTDDFEISSAVAEISIKGRTGLADRDYENIVEVIPDVGGGLAGITALLVNLPAGIGLWLVDKITGEQFNEASSKTYEISGSWESPVIEKVEE